jgi:uroporphyrinogen decarboxylase
MPDRVPFSWGFGPTREMAQHLRVELAEGGIDWDRLRQETDDVIAVEPAYTGPSLSEGMDIWGVRRKRVRYDGGEYMEVEDPPLSGTTRSSELNAYPWPDPDAFDYEGFPHAMDAVLAERGPRAVRVRAGNPLEQYTWLTGMEETMVNLLTQPDLVRCALERIGDFWQGRLERLLAAGGDRVDLLFFADDLGGQNGPLISEQTYLDVVQPVHRRLFATAHELAPQAKVLYHSDGSVAALIPALLDAGIDCLEAVQIECEGMDPGRLKADYGSCLAFHGAISVQRLLPRESADTVEVRCRELVKLLGQNGGYIAAPSHAVQMGTPTANVMAMLRGVLGTEGLEQTLAAAHT